jgi:hypothetical protein
LRERRTPSWKGKEEEGLFAYCRGKLGLRGGGEREKRRPI